MGYSVELKAIAQRLLLTGEDVSSARVLLIALAEEPVTRWTVGIWESWRKNVIPEVSALILGPKDTTKLLSASETLEHNWSLSTTRTECQEVTSEISIGIEPGDEVSVFQVVGECKNSDGTVYTIKTPTYVIKGNDGSSETKEADFSEAGKMLS